MKHDVCQGLFEIYRELTGRSPDSFAGGDEAADYIDSIGQAQTFLVLAERFTEGEYRFDLNDANASSKALRSLLAAMIQTTQPDAYAVDSGDIAADVEPFPEATADVDLTSLPGDPNTPTDNDLEEFPGGDPNTIVDD